MKFKYIFNLHLDLKCVLGNNGYKYKGPTTNTHSRHIRLNHLQNWPEISWPEISVCPARDITGKVTKAVMKSKYMWSTEQLGDA